MRSKLPILFVVVGFVACGQSYDETGVNTVTAAQSAACNAPADDPEVDKAIEIWYRYQSRPLGAMGITGDAAKALSRKFALMAVDGGGVAVKCCDDIVGCLPGDWSAEGCLAHLSLLGCSEGMVPVCDEEECWCSPTC